jgi:hypothetical protein
MRVIVRAWPRHPRSPKKTSGAIRGHGPRISPSEDTWEPPSTRAPRLSVGAVSPNERGCAGAIFELSSPRRSIACHPRLCCGFFISHICEMTSLPLDFLCPQEPPWGECNHARSSVHAVLPHLAGDRAEPGQSQRRLTHQRQPRQRRRRVPAPQIALQEPLRGACQTQDEQTRARGEGPSPHRRH